MKKTNRNLGQFANVIFDKFGKTEEVQVLNFTTKFVEGSNTLASSTVAFVNQWALATPVDSALYLDRFVKYCKSDKATFNISDIITINTFKSYSHYTLKSCATGSGLCRVVADKKYFFCVYRQKRDGKIMGCWLPYTEDNQKLMGVEIISREANEKAQLEKKKKMLEKLQKELGL